MFQTMNCKRCGRQIITMTKPVFSSESTMKKWQGICQYCVTEKEKMQMMMDMNGDVRRKING